MKTMTLTIPFISIFYLVLLFGNPAVKDVKTNTVFGSNKIISEIDSNIESLPPIVYTKENHPLRLNKNKKYLAVLKNNKNCSECFKSLNEFIKQIKSGDETQFILISLIDSSSLERKRNHQFNIKLMPDMDSYYFQFYNSENINYFAKLSIKYTPEIILIDKEKYTRLTYQQIFEFPSLDISATALKKVNELLK